MNFTIVKKEGNGVTARAAYFDSTTGRYFTEAIGVPSDVRQIIAASWRPDGEYIVKSARVLATLERGTIYGIRASSHRRTISRYDGIIKPLNSYDTVYNGLFCCDHTIVIDGKCFAQRHRPSAGLSAEAFHKTLYEARRAAGEVQRWYVPYGSFARDESRDRDFVVITSRGDAEFALADGFFHTNDIPPDNLAYGDDVFNLERDLPESRLPFARLAVACMEWEYKGVADLLRGYNVLDYPLEKAVKINTGKRRDVARDFPFDYTVRKAIFATLQQRSVEYGVFADSKTACLEFANAAERDVFRRILFHEGNDDDVEAAYRLLFGTEYRPPEKVLVFRNQYIIFRDGQLYSGYLSSNYEPSEPEPLTEREAWFKRSDVGIMFDTVEAADSFYIGL